MSERQQEAADSIDVWEYTQQDPQPHGLQQPAGLYDPPLNNQDTGSQQLQYEQMQVSHPAAQQIGVPLLQQLMDAEMPDVALLELELEKSIKRLENAKDSRSRRKQKESVVGDYILRFPPTTIKQLRTRYRFLIYLQKMYRYQRGVIVPGAFDYYMKSTTFEEDQELQALDQELEEVLETAGKKTLPRRKREVLAKIEARTRQLEEQLGNDELLFRNKTPQQCQAIEDDLAWFDYMEEFFCIVHFFEEEIEKSQQDDNSTFLNNVEYRTEASNYVPEEITSIVKCNDSITISALWEKLEPAWKYLIYKAEDLRKRPIDEAEWPKGTKEFHLLGGGFSGNIFHPLYNVAIRKDGEIPETSIVLAIEDLQEQLVAKNAGHSHDFPDTTPPYPWVTRLRTWESFEVWAREQLFHLPENDRFQQKHLRLILVIYICLGYVTVEKAKIVQDDDQQLQLLSAVCLQSISLWNRPLSRDFYAIDDQVARIALYVFCLVAVKFEKKTLHPTAESSMGFHGVWQVLKGQYQLEESQATGELGLVGEDGLDSLPDIIQKEADTREASILYLRPELIVDAWSVWCIEYVLNGDLVLQATSWSWGRPITTIDQEQMQIENALLNEQMAAQNTPEVLAERQRQRDARRAARKRQKQNKRTRAREAVRAQLRASDVRRDVASSSAAALPSSGQGWDDADEPMDGMW